VKRSVSCTILCYNEQQTLAAAVQDVRAALARLADRDFEILIVDDGSIDDSAAVARELENRYEEVHLIRHGRNLGPGSAILTGIRNSRGDVICFHAADQQLKFDEVASFIPLLDDCDIVIGSRSGRPGYTRMRRLSSEVYIRLVQGLFGLHDYDDFNFLYLYRRELFDGMPITSDGVFLCTEILIRALDRGARVAQVSATCLPREQGVSAVYRVPVVAKTLGEMARFWWRYRVRGSAAARSSSAQDGSASAPMRSRSVASAAKSMTGSGRGPSWT
jgi:glycosyltransferase involved in cell wall biosynthesis